MSNKYDPNTIIASANEKLHDGDLEGGQLVFQSALLTWVDDARESFSTMSEEEASLVREAIATLWLAYAQFLISAKQYKSASEAYEQAVSCPIGRTSGRVWLEYARFAEERKKFKTAQDIFIRALVGNETTSPPPLDEQDQQLLWSEFLGMVRVSSNNPKLTLEELRTAVIEEGYVDNAPVNDDVAPTETTSSSSSIPPPTKRRRIDDMSTSPVPDTNVSGTTTTTATHVVTEDAVREESTAFSELLIQGLPTEVATAWMLRDGTELAQPPLSLFGPAPPKLSDPTGKELMGIETAVQLLHILVKHGHVVLDVVKGLWMLQALTERESSDTMDGFDKTMKSQATALHENLRARLSMTNDATRAAVTFMNDNEWKLFRNNCQQQRQQLLTQIAWEHRRVLCIQQQILTKLGVPNFDGPSVDVSVLDLQRNMCSYLHSAFYLRNRVGQQPHETMLKSQIKRLEKDLERLATSSPIPPERTSSPVPAMAAGHTGSPAPYFPQYGHPSTQGVSSNVGQPYPPSMYNPSQMSHPPPPPPPQAPQYSMQQQPHLMPPIPSYPGQSTQPNASHISGSTESHPPQQYGYYPHR